MENISQTNACVLQGNYRHFLQNLMVQWTDSETVWHSGIAIVYDIPD